MLIISRKKNESIMIQGGIEIFILDVQGDKVRVGIDAPNNIKIMRKELVETEAFNKEAMMIPDKTEIQKFKSILKSVPIKKNTKDEQQ